MLHVFTGVKQTLGVPGVDRLQAGTAASWSRIDEPGPCRRVFGNHPLNGFGLQLDAGVLGLLAVPRDEPAGNAQQVRGFDQLHGAASNGRPLFVRLRLALFGAAQETIVATAFQRTSDSGSTIDVMMSLTVAVGLNCDCGGGLLAPVAAAGGQDENAEDDRLW